MKKSYHFIKMVTCLVVFALITAAVLPLSALGQKQSAPQASAAAEEFTSYTGTLYHVFFHSLIIDTKAAFSSGNSGGYNDWMTTREEFKNMLYKLYAGGFVLVDLKDIFVQESSGRVVQKTLYLPAGKKPLIISVDDVNYYDYMKGEGFADSLAIDGLGKVTAVVVEKGVKRYDREGDVVPILDDFVEAHPDFSPFGAKGILAVTGYQGVFGYRVTTLTGEDLAVAKASARAVAKKLTATGWTIASHSYTHSRKFRDGTVTLDALKQDTQKWKSEIGALVGQTPIFIAPFGIAFPDGDPRMNYLVGEGYYIFCPIYKEMTSFCRSNYAVSHRLNLDGLTMRLYPQRISKYFFNPAAVLDPSRPA